MLAIVFYFYFYIIYCNCSQSQRTNSSQIDMLRSSFEGEANATKQRSQICSKARARSGADNLSVSETEMLLKFLVVCVGGSTFSW